MMIARMSSNTKHYLIVSAVVTLLPMAACACVIKSYGLFVCIDHSHYIMYIHKPIRKYTHTQAHPCTITPIQKHTHTHVPSPSLIGVMKYVLNYPPRSTVLFAILNRLSTGQITLYCL